LYSLTLAAETARFDLKRATDALPAIQTFALERLRPALAALLPGTVDPQHAVLRWVDPEGKRAPLQQSLLEAALLNFHEADTQAAAFAEGSGLFAGVGADGQADRARPLPLRPEGLAKCCRGLDIGGLYQLALGEHITARVPGRGSVITATPSLAWRVFDAQCKGFAADAWVARLAGQLGSRGEALLAQWGWASPEVIARPALAQRLGLFDFPLSQLMVFSPARPTDQDQAVVAYLPGDPEGPVIEYPNAASFATALGARLESPAFLKFFSGFVPLGRRLAFIEQVKAAIKPGTWLPAHLTWTAVPISGDPFVEGYRTWAQQTRAEAASMAVPTGMLDHQDTFERYEHWVDLGEQLGLTLALMVGSALPGVNLIADAIVLGQGLYNVYQGVQAWQQGDSQAALEHVFGAVENAAFFGLGKRPEPLSATASHFASQLVPVTAADGQVRLWRPSLDDFRARDLPAPGTERDSAGVYRHDGRAWITLDGHLHEVAADATATSARLLHPDRDGYAPVVHGDGAGHWRASHERPAQWDSLTLVRRFDPRYEQLPVRSLLEALRLTHITDVQLRQAHLGGEGMPGLLKHVLARRLAEHTLDQAQAALHGNRRMGRLATPLVEALRSLPGWPQEVALDYYTAGMQLRFGPANAARSARLDQAALQDGRWPARLISQLEPADLDALLGLETSLVPASAAHDVFAERWASTLARRREEWIERLVERQVPVSQAVLTLRRQFPGLPAECIDTLVRKSTHAQRRALETGRMPPAVAEQAAEALRQLRVIRACDALAQGRTSADVERLVFALLPRLGGWAAELRLELRDHRLDGPLIQASGPLGARRWVIVRSGERYQALDHRGLELSGRVSLEAAIFAVLPDDARAAAPTVVSAEGLRLGMYEQALGQYSSLRPLLGLLPDNRRFFRPPSRRANGALGYELSGRGRPLRGSPEGGDPYRVGLQALYPDISDAEMTELRASLGEGEAATTALARLNAELAQLRLELGAWIERAPDSAAEYAPLNEADNRRALANELIALWQRRQVTLAYGGLGYGLNLRSWPVTELPTLSVRFEHARRVVAQDMDLHQVGEGFLQAFPNLTWLDLSMNSQLEMPGLSHLTRLERLSLDYTGTRDAQEVIQAALPAAATLNHIDLVGTGVTLTPADFQALRQFPVLRALDLQDNQITLDEQTATGFNALTSLQDLNLNANPLGRAPVLSRLHDLTIFEARDANLNEFPPGLVDLMERSPLRLWEINLSNNNIEELPDLEHTRFMQLYRQGQDEPHSDYAALRINLNGNPLSDQARAMLTRSGVTFFAESDRSSVSSDSHGQPPNPEQWLLGCPEPLRALIQEERASHEAAEFYALLSQVTGTEDYRTAPVQSRERTWRLVETWLRPADQGLPGLEELRQRLFGMARDTLGTCGDGVALTLDDMEFEVQAWRIVASSQAPGDGPLLDLLTFQRGLWRRALVDDAARRIVRARVARREALANANGADQPLPALDVSDDVADARLDEGIDEVEVRFFLAQQLEGTLGLPESRTMRYSTRVSGETVRRVGAEVLAADTTGAFAAWVAERPGFRTYLEHAHAQAFEPVRQRWQEAANYLYCLGSEPPSSAGEWPAALNGLIDAQPDVPWQTEDGRVPHPNEQQLRLAYDWVRQQQQRELDTLALQLTRQLLRLEAIP
jgi:hypothetical protein